MVPGGGEEAPVCPSADDSNPCVWCQVGIVSFGPAPCDATIPGVYTRVAAYRQWMEDTVAMHGGW